MKKIIFISLIMFALLSNAQVFYAPNKTTTFVDTTTTYKYVIDEKTYNVFKSKKGAFYIWKISKSGKLYKMYLPKETQIKMGRKY